MTKRIEHIDSIRAIAVLLMVMVHAAATWGPPSTTQPSGLVYVVSGLGGLAAPLFVTVFGWGCVQGNSTHLLIIQSVLTRYPGASIRPFQLRVRSPSNLTRVCEIPVTGSCVMSLN